MHLIHQVIIHHVYGCTYSYIGICPSVLVAHNGFEFDFPILLAEIDRRPRDLSCNHLVAQHLHFADTLPHLRQVQSCIIDMFLDTVHAYTCNHFIQAKKDGHHGSKDVCKFGLESLYCDFFPSKTYPGMISLPRT